MIIPIWVYFVVTGIIISAFMAVKTGREERQFEQEMIEREGDIYMQRLETEKEQRKQNVHGAEG
ncbi:sporulation YhaL family protein [Bacillus marasmi]|uniref:sporulation YhaL family protein n=1 Tax=Bacillus marasmi TaxID=1926279 RepID=UPI00164DBB17|nr:sporulation YhaL family protein [Bacillus marasmi]